MRITSLITFFILAVAPLVGQTPVSGQPVPELSTLDTLMPQLLSKWNIPGATLAISRDGKLIFARGYGYADTASQTSVQPDSLFRIASLSKPFTATAILKLIEQGKLQATTTPFTSILGDLTPPTGQTPDPRLAQITIQNLLEHKGGWDDTLFGVEDPAFADMDVAAQAFNAPAPATPDLLIRYMLGQPLQHDPGTTYAYSNFGYIVLGQVIERVSGQRYEDFVRDQVLTPAGIQRMRLGGSLQSQRAPDEVTYYAYPGAPLVPSVLPPLNAQVPSPYGSFSMELMPANAGWIASTIDLLRYADTMGGRLQPSILQSPPLGFVSYVPPVGDGWWWQFYGSLAGSNSILHVDTGVQLSGRVSWTVLMNTRAGVSTAQPSTAVDAAILTALQGITNWPTADLSAAYSGAGSSCSFAMADGGASVRSQGGSGSISMTATNYCGWTAVASAPWITLTSPAQGAGNGAITYWLSANAGTNSRIGSISAGGQTFGITQQGSIAGQLAATSLAPIGTQGGLRFVPVTPCRVTDTRWAAGALGGPSIAAQTSRIFALPNGSCGIPANAQAYALNVTVVPQSILSYLTVWPAGEAQPLVSTLNSPDGRVKANAAIVPAGAGGAIAVYATDATDVALDVTGYFVAATNASALEFFPLAPCRVIDTRVTQGALSANEARAFAVGASACNLPANAQAYALNVTAVPHGALSYLTAWPTGQAQPFVSLLNAPTGAVTANAAIVPAGVGGSISLYATDETDVVVDVNGYFAPPAPAGLAFYPLAPCRVFDSRRNGRFAGAVTVDVAASDCGVPAASTYALNATVVPTGPLGYLALWPGLQPQPLASTLNSPDGMVTSNMALVEASGSLVDAYGSSATALILDIAGYFAL